MDKSLEINIDMELEAARIDVRDAIISVMYATSKLAGVTEGPAVYSARSAYLAAWSVEGSDQSAANSAWSLVNVTSSYDDERLKQIEMIKDIL